MSEVRATLGRRDALRITAVAGVSAVFGGGLLKALVRDAGLRRVSRTQTRMGTLVTLTVVHPEADAADAMVRNAFGEMERLEQILSRHRPTSALGRLNAEGALVDPPRELVTVLDQALRLSEATEGAFDPSVLPVLELYRASFEATGRHPAPDALEETLRLVGFRNVTVGAARISLDRPGMGITLDGIAKGFVVDECVRLLTAEGAGRVFVDAGGDVGTTVGPALDEAWRVAVHDPHQRGRPAPVLSLAGDALATSADDQHSFTLDRRIHHIVDPRTGRSPEETSSVSVRARTAMQADGLSTAVMVMGPARGLPFLEDIDGAEALVVTKVGRRLATSGLRGAVAMAGLLAAALLQPCLAFGQPATGATPTAASAPVADSAPLFASHDVLSVELAADYTALKGDRSESPDRPGTLTVVVDERRVSIPVEVRTRGAFRLDPANCSFPPLRIDVDLAEAARGTPFEGQDDLKLVSSCRPERSSWDPLVVKEYLAYRTVGAVTSESFQVRPLSVSFLDTGVPTASPEVRFAFVLENEDALARRLGATVFDLEEGKNLPPAVFHPVSRMTAALAQYMVANPDWSEVAGHNVEILERRGGALAIPYDFDFSGLVDAPYATAPPEYQLASVRERYYRGWCENPLVTAEVLGRFRTARADVRSLWTQEPGLPDDVRAQAVRFLDDFFDAIESDERARRRFLRDCRSLPG